MTDSSEKKSLIVSNFSAAFVYLDKNLYAKTAEEYFWHHHCYFLSVGILFNNKEQ